LGDVSAGKLSTPETWARDTGYTLAVFTGRVVNPCYPERSASRKQVVKVI